MRTLALLAVVAATMALGSARPRAANAELVAVASVSVADVQAVDRTLTEMQRDGTLRPRATVEDSVLPGRVHERLDQYHNGIRVFGGDVVRQTTLSGATVSVFGQSGRRRALEALRRDC